jgi:hypothetical protein
MISSVQSSSMIRLKRIYNFLCSMLVYTPFALCFVYTSWRFYAFSRTNLLTRCHSASSCFLLFLCFRKVTQEIFLELNKTKDGVQRRAGGGPRDSHTRWWRGPPLGRTTRWCDHLVHLLTSPFRLFIPFIEKTLRAQTLF